MQTFLIYLPIIVTIVFAYWKTPWSTPIFLISILVSLIAYNSSKNDKYHGLLFGFSLIGAFASSIPLYQTLRFNKPLNTDATFVFWFMVLYIIDWVKKEQKQ